MQSAVTRAFEAWNVNKVVDGLPAVPDSVVFALIPDQDENALVNRDEGMPAAEHIRHRAAITQAGILNTNAVVYSVVLDTTIGDWDYNWIGLVDSQTNTVLMIVHVRTQQKLKTRNGQQGNSLTRNLSMQFDGAAEATQINVSAATWQIDFSARLFGMDEAHRLAMRDYYGNAAFLNDGFRVSLANGVATVAAGVGYVGGLRVRLDAAASLNVSANTSVWLDVSRQGTVTGAWENRITFTAVPALADYTDHAGYVHYVARLGEIVNGQLTDSRPVSPLSALDDKFLPINGTAVTAKKLATPRKIAGVPFDGTADITLNASHVGALARDQNGADIANTALFAKNAQVPHLGGSWIEFGGSAGNWTTSQFIDFLNSLGAFDHLYFVCAGTWSFSANKKIIDTNCGNIELAGAVVEVFASRFNLRTVRVTTMSGSSDPNAVQGQFVYVESVTPGSGEWRREFNTKNLAAADIGALQTNEIVGIPMPWPLATIPDGWLACAGQPFDTARYPILASRYPSGILLDLRGEFIRGWDNGRGVDPERANGSGQGYATESHTHAGGSLEVGSGSPLYAGKGLQDGTGVLFSRTGVNNNAGTETRPRNIALNYIVRAA